METFKKSTGSYNNNKSILKHFFNYIKKPIKEITIFDVMDYFENSLDKEPDKNEKAIKISTKNTRRYTLKAFFNYVRKQYLKEGVDYRNPIPDKDIFQFTKRKQDIRRQTNMKLPILSKNQIGEILDFLNPPKKFTENIYRNYLLFLLVICTGARISEIRTLYIKDINLMERLFESGFVKDARKTSLRSEESLLFFFPDNIIQNLEMYITKRKHTSDFLFYSPKSPNIPLSHELSQYICSSTSKALGFKFTWHYFRKTLITERIKMGCSEGLSEGLSNHIGKSVQWESYIKLSIKERRDKYDEFFPYKELKKFKKS